MTLAALLEELKVADPEIYEDIGDIVNVISILSDGSFSSDAYYPDFIIQGCIQRACERREWPFHVAYYPPEGPNAPYYQAYIWPALKCHTAQADSAAEALLAAYIAAVRVEAKR